MGIFYGNIGRQGGFLIGANRHQRDAGPNWGNMSGWLSSFAQGFGGLGFASVRGDDGHDRSFITRDQRDAGPNYPKIH
jgi:hypothetical protein